VRRAHTGGEFQVAFDGVFGVGFNFRRIKKRCGALADALASKPASLEGLIAAASTADWMSP